MDPSRLIPGDATLIENIVNYLKAKGIFDEFRHECLADVDTKSSCQNLNQRVDGYAAKFLANETWNPDLNKNELRNKLRRHIDESGMLAGGTDHVVDQVINPKIHSFFLPKIIEVVHQYVKEQTELFQKKNVAPSENIANAPDASETAAPKTKTVISDPIADILSFTQFKAKPSATSSSQLKSTDGKKKREEETVAKKRDQELVEKKNVQEGQELTSKNISSIGTTEAKLINDKEKVKKTDEAESSFDQSKKSKEDSKFEEKNKRKSLQEPLEASLKSQNSSEATEAEPQNDKEKSKKDNIEEDELHSDQSKKSRKENDKEDDFNSELPKKIKEEIKTDKIIDDGMTQKNDEHRIEEHKDNLPVGKENAPSKKEPEKSKFKSKTSEARDTKYIKKHKKESSEKSSDQRHKHKSTKLSNEPISPSKKLNSSKVSSKEGKTSHASKSNSSSSKSSDSASKKHSGYDSKHQRKNQDKHKSSNTSDLVKDTLHSEPTAYEKEAKASLSSSSQDSSQNSDPERSAKREKSSRHPHLKENTQKPSSSSADKASSEKKHFSEDLPKKQPKPEKPSRPEKHKDALEAEKVRSSSSGSVSSPGSLSNISKENSASNSDEGSDSSKDKKRKHGKDACMPPSTPPLPPPPPPPSSSLPCEDAQGAEMSSAEDSHSSSESVESSYSVDLFSDCEAEVNRSLLDQLEKMYKEKPGACISENDVYDIFLYSSSSSDFEGYSSPVEKTDPPVPETEMDLSVSSVHTSDLSSYDDELSADEFSLCEENTKKITLKKAQQLLQERAALRLSNNNKNSIVNESFEDKVIKERNQRSNPSLLSSDDEMHESEPKRSLRRERRVNPRYASSEYTSIFNSKKETFITKQLSPSKKNETSVSMVATEVKHRKRPSVEKNTLALDVKHSPATLKNSNTSSLPSNVSRVLEEHEIKKEPLDLYEIIDKEGHQPSLPITTLEKSELGTFRVSEKNKTSPPNLVLKKVGKINQKNSLGKGKNNEEKICLVPIGEKNKINSLSRPDKVDPSTKDEELFKENNENLTLTELHMNPQNSQLHVNTHSMKRKLKLEEAASTKRPCSQSSVSSESVANENKPYNSEKQKAVDEELFQMCDLKSSDLNESMQSQYFCKEWTNNNGDRVLLNSHGISKSSSERKGKDSSSNKELSAS